MKQSNDTTLISTCGMVAGGLAIAIFGFLMYCIATSTEKQMVVNEHGQLQEVELND